MSLAGINQQQQQQQQHLLHHQLQLQQPIRAMELIKRPQHNLKLSQVLNNMLQCGSLVDVTIYCDDGQVNAHKLVLAASSTYFRNLFNRMTNAFHYPIIVLREIPVNDLKTIIQFIYHGEVNVPHSRVDSLMRCANYLQIDGMASSTNSLNAILASSSASIASHHSLISNSNNHATSGGPIITPNSTNTTSNNNSTSTPLNKIHPQYPLTSNCKQSRGGHSSRSNNNNTNNSSNNTNNNIINNNSSSNNLDNNTSGKPRHICPVCLKTFTHGFTLKRHMKLHNQARLTIYCDVCSKSYSCKDSFLRHKKSSGHLQHAEFHHRSIDLNINSDR